MPYRYQTKIIHLDNKTGKVTPVLMTRAALAALAPEVRDRLVKAFPNSEGYQISSYATENISPFRPVDEIPCECCNQ